MRMASQPGPLSGVENPKPGSEGMTRSKASAGSRPWLRGSVSGPMTSRNSTKLEGQPWISMSGVAPGLAERMCRKWIVCPSISVTNCG